MKPVTPDARLAATSSVSGEVTIHNRLPSKHPRRLAFEDAIRSRLAGLDGKWDVVVELAGELSLLVAVIAPDGSAWTMSCCNPEHRNPETIAEIVGAACSRRRWPNPSGAAAEDAGAGAAAPAAIGDGAPASLRRSHGTASMPARRGSRADRR